jgi:hypothetical protein
MVLGLLVAMVCVFYTRAQADVKLIVALTGFMQNHHRLLCREGQRRAKARLRLFRG